MTELIYRELNLMASTSLHNFHSHGVNILLLLISKTKNNILSSKFSCKKYKITPKKVTLVEPYKACHSKMTATLFCGGREDVTCPINLVVVTSQRQSIVHYIRMRSKHSNLQRSLKVNKELLPTKKENNHWELSATQRFATPSP